MPGGCCPAGVGTVVHLRTAYRLVEPVCQCSLALLRRFWRSVQGTLERIDVSGVVSRNLFSWRFDCGERGSPAWVLAAAIGEVRSARVVRVIFPPDGC
mmetsp:Transcript_39085/g.93805  ORF Transcript_39085/g.93805 Transcript_39085/m.93805 type:complete len:98 (+) Transcript_39085:2350-2643(+)